MNVYKAVLFCSQKRQAKEHESKALLINPVIQEIHNPVSSYVHAKELNPSGTACSALEQLRTTSVHEWHCPFASSCTPGLWEAAQGQS